MPWSRLRCLSVHNASSVHRRRLYHIDGGSTTLPLSCIPSSVLVHLLGPPRLRLTLIVTSSTIVQRFCFVSTEIWIESFMHSYDCEKEARNRLMDLRESSDGLYTRYCNKITGRKETLEPSFEQIKWPPGVRIPVWPFRT